MNKTPPDLSVILRGKKEGAMAKELAFLQDFNGRVSDWNSK